MTNQRPVAQVDICLVTTGGTIDKVYSGTNDSYAIGPAVAQGILHDSGYPGFIEVVELFRKDSLDITDADRAAIRDAIVRCKSDRIIVTHGTDTMVETAKSLIGLPGRIIVLTGALQPARFRDSDAAFNLGMAVAAVQIAAEGVYIAASGRVFPASNVRKSAERNRFEALDPAVTRGDSRTIAI